MILIKKYILPIFFASVSWISGFDWFLVFYGKQKQTKFNGH